MRAHIARAHIAGRIFTGLAPGEAANDASNAVISLRRQYGRLPLLHELQFSSALRRRLLDTRDRLDIIHSHGLRRMPNIYAYLTAR